MYNAISVVIFHFSWKMQSDVWGSINEQGVVTHITGGNFVYSSIFFLIRSESNPNGTKEIDWD